MAERIQDQKDINKQTKVIRTRAAGHRHSGGLCDKHPVLGQPSMLQHQATPTSRRIQHHRNTLPRDVKLNVKSQRSKKIQGIIAQRHQVRPKPRTDVELQIKSRSSLKTLLQGFKLPEDESKCPATQDNQRKSMVNVRKFSRPIQSSEKPMMSPIQCPVVRQSTKDSDTLITCPQAAKYNDSAKNNYIAKSNYTAKYSYRAKHNYKFQFSPEESRSRPYLPRQVNLNVFRASAKARWSRLAEGFIVNVDGSPTSFLISKRSTPNEVLLSPPVSRLLPRARPYELA
ncbi:unnamed protein product [Caenorhabditis nigoni]